MCLTIIYGLCLVGCGNAELVNTDSNTDVTETVSEEMYGELSWPKSDIAALIPIPKSNIGKVEWEASYGFVVYVAETSIQEFMAYADACYDQGFNVNYRRGDDYFYADNESGYHLSLNMRDNDVMFVRMDEPDEIEEDESELKEDINEVEGTEESSEIVDIENESEDTQSTDEASDDIRPEFKDFLDSYESYMNEYCEFMKKYTESNYDSTMLGDYNMLMIKYAEFAEKMSDLEDGEMNEAETKYYTEVVFRVSQKLLEVSQ